MAEENAVWLGTIATCPGTANIIKVQTLPYICAIFYMFYLWLQEKLITINWVKPNSPTTCSSIQSMPNTLLTFSTTMEYGTMQINEKAFCNL